MAILRRLVVVVVLWPNGLSLQTVTRLGQFIQVVRSDTTDTPDCRLDWNSSDLSILFAIAPGDLTDAPTLTP